jgi:hypothetical protein
VEPEECREQVAVHVEAVLRTDVPALGQLLLLLFPADAGLGEGEARVVLVEGPAKGLPRLRAFSTNAPGARSRIEWGQFFCHER